MDNLQQLIDLQQEIHQWAREWGFWENGQDRNKGEMIMLMITELSEAVEAHRKNKRAIYWDSFVALSEEDWMKDFISYKKDTVEDEIADTVIRILDYTAGWNLSFRPTVMYLEESTDNLAEDVLRIVEVITRIPYHNPAMSRYWDWSLVLAAIIKFCDWYQIDLLQHIQWKMRYNRTRPHKHGKAY
jgi:NTP pyrophosphatase (non-canonical NTP hydrolase)